MPAIPPRPDRLISGFHTRNVLPHLKRAGGTYFVTFRLAGTLPADVLLRFKQERELILHQALAARRPLTWAEQVALFQWYSTRVDRYLDVGHGDCWLRRDDAAGVVAEALRHFDGDRYELSAWVVMPNHVHAVVRPLGDRSLSKVLQGWKSYTATVLNRLLARPGRPFWQTESYDHLIRDDADRERCCHYTVMNPVNAGLCARPEDWRWSSAYCPPP